MASDFFVFDAGSIIQIQPRNEDVFNWLDENCDAESWNWMGNNLCVERRYAPDIIEGLKEAGFNAAA